MYFAVLIFSVTIICCQSAYFDNYDYCSFPCHYGGSYITHVVCQRENDCSVDKQKCTGYEPIAITDKIKTFILDEHNKLRNKVASGSETRGSGGLQPPAANMMALKYNDELGFVAQCWANTCQLHKHSQCHRTSNMRFVGQNLALRQNTAKEMDGNLEKSIKLMIHSWFDEVELFNPKDMKPFKFNYDTGHYTVMVWGEVQEIGCGIIKFREGKWYSLSMVCNYGSTKVAGNIIDGEMYRVGAPASNCPKNTKPNRRFPALCGQDTLDLRREDESRLNTYFVPLNDTQTSEQKEYENKKSIERLIKQYFNNKYPYPEYYEEK